MKIYFLEMREFNSKTKLMFEMKNDSLLIIARSIIQMNIHRIEYFLHATL